MGKNKYKPEGSVTAEGGERKQRDHTKTGKLAARRETLRLEAIARQTRRVMEVESALAGKKVNDKLSAYISTFKTVGDALDHARLSLEKIRGGVPHSTLEAELKGTPAVKPVEIPAVVDEKPKNKYRRKKQQKSGVVNQNGEPI